MEQKSYWLKPLLQSACLLLEQACFCSNLNLLILWNSCRKRNYTHYIHYVTQQRVQLLSCSRVCSAWTMHDNFTMVQWASIFKGKALRNQYVLHMHFHTHTHTHTNTTFDHQAHFLLSRQTSEGVWQAKPANRVTDSRTSVNQVNQTMRPFDISGSCFLQIKTNINVSTHCFQELFWNKTLRLRKADFIYEHKSHFYIYTWYR